MTIKSIEQDFIDKVSEKVRVVPDGKDRFRVFTPFRFDDGDHIAIVLKKEQGRWLLSDGGHTYMHLTYDIDERKLFKGTREKIISNALSTFNVEDRFGELILEVKDARFGDALYAFAQALIKMGDVLCLSDFKPTFIDDFQSLLHEVVPTENMKFNWNDPKYDSDRKYIVDCRINGLSEPLFIYALDNNGRIRDATIKIRKAIQWEIPFQPLGIFQDRGVANRQVVARFNDVCEVQFPKMDENQNEISTYIEKYI